MVDKNQLLDCIHLQKYIYILSLYTSQKIETSIFEEIFLKLRREDAYWFAGLFNTEISKLLDTFFLDVDEYTPKHLLNPNDKFSIDEAELHKRAVKILNKLIKVAVDT